MKISEIHDAGAKVTYAHPDREQVIKLVLAASNASFLLSELGAAVPSLHKEWFLSASKNLRGIMAELEEQSLPNKPSYLLEVAFTAYQDTQK